MDETSTTLKIVVVGDPTVGKYCLINSYVSQTFPEDNIMDWARLFEKDATVDGRTYQLKILFMAAYENYKRIRPLAYPDADVFIVCFSLINKNTYVDVSENWYPEVRHYCPKVPIVLVGTQSDMIGKKGHLIAEDEGRELMEKIGAVDYIECSAKESRNIEEVFTAAVRAAIICKNKKRKGSKCTIC